MGFNFLAICLFWHSERFNSIDRSMFTLFAVMNGDNVAAVYEDLSFSRYGATIFMYGYTFFAICCITNIFIIVIEEGYINAKYSSKKELIKFKMLSSQNKV